MIHGQDGSSKTLLPTLPCKKFSGRYSTLLGRRKYHSWRCPTTILKKSCCAEGRPQGHRVWDWDLKGYIPWTEWACVKPVPWLLLYLWSDTENILAPHHSLVSPHHPSLPGMSFLPPQLSEAMSPHYRFLLFSSPFFSLLCPIPSHRQFGSPGGFLGGWGGGTRIALLPHDGNCTQSTGIPL